MKSRFGRLEGVSADFYITAQGEKRMEIYYTGISEKKLSYHKITLIGDSFGGYKVAGIMLSERPHPEHRTAKRFDG